MLNPICPECKTENLVAFVTATYKNVPLSKDGYDMSGGKFMDGEINAIECTECGYEDDGSCYYREEEEENE
jgi:hypothetical protein